MAHKRYVVELTSDERSQLKAVLKQMRVAAKKRMRAQVLLKVDEGEEGPSWSHVRAAEVFDVHVNTITSVARKLVREGFEGSRLPSTARSTSAQGASRSLIAERI